MGAHDIIVLGASAGGIEALSQLLSRLPLNLPASVFVVVHIPAHAMSVLPRIFSRHGPLPAEHATGYELIRPGKIYVAPPDHHLLVQSGRVVLSRGPKENGHRPAVDPLFRSAALAYGPRVIAVVLSGSLDDGSAGMAAVKERGGVTIAQSPEEALYPSMPRSAILNRVVDHVRPVAEIADLLVSLSGDPPEAEAVMVADPALEHEARYDQLDPRVIHESEHPGTPSGLGCPDCGGTLWELSGSLPMRYRCRVGHAWTAEALLARQADTMESALWTALRTLEERASLCQKLSGRLNESGSTYSSSRLLAQAEECLRSAEVLRAMIAAERPVDVVRPPPGADRIPGSVPVRDTMVSATTTHSDPPSSTEKVS